MSNLKWISFEFQIDDTPAGRGFSNVSPLQENRQADKWYVPLISASRRAPRASRITAANEFWKSKRMLLIEIYFDLDLFHNKTASF